MNALRKKRELYEKKLNNYFRNKLEQPCNLSSEISEEFSQVIQDHMDMYKNKLQNIKNSVKTRRICKKNCKLTKLFSILPNKNIASDSQLNLNQKQIDSDQFVSDSNDEAFNLNNSYSNLNDDKTITAYNGNDVKKSVRAQNKRKSDESVFGDIFGSSSNIDEGILESSRCDLTSLNLLSKNITDKNSVNSLNLFENISIDSEKLLETIDDFYFKKNSNKHYETSAPFPKRSCVKNDILKEANDVTDRVNDLKKGMQEDEFFTANFIDKFFNE